MKIAISFTSTLRSVFDGDLDLSAIESFYFGCAREHLFPKESDLQLVPMEVTWLNAEKKRVYDKNYALLSECDGPALRAWYTLRDAVRNAEKESKVFWKDQTGDRCYPDLAKRLLGEGHQVFLNGGWVQPSYFGKV